MISTTGNRRLGVALVIVAALITAFGLPAAGAIDNKEANERMTNSIEVLGEIINIPEHGIPKSVLSSCRGLIVIPHMVKGGFIVAANRGHGIMIHRLPSGQWSDPSFCTITGGSVGFQIGGQATDLILVVNNEKGFQALLSDNFKFGGQASVAAGPVGRDASAGTDAKLSAEIYSYSRTKGVFAGVSLEGAGLTVDADANTAFYGKAVDAKQVVQRHSKPYPAAALDLLKLLKPYSAGK
jgi:lipid-binding SYLF domain-containing protein